MKPPPATCWLHDAFEVRPSPIEGHGLFAARPVAAGTVVARFGGRLVSTAELEALLARASADPASPYVDTIALEEDLHLVLARGEALHFANHSCDPSLWLAGRYTLAARRDLAPGEEATTDYATMSSLATWRMPCRCGSALCRREVTGDDWRLPALHVRYGDRWTPVLLLRIRGDGR